MKKILLILGLVSVAAGAGFAQKKVDSDPNTTTTKRAPSTKSDKSSANGSETGSMLQAGTQIAAQLQSSLDVKNAKVGDEVILKTTKAVKDKGQIVVQKGAQLIGRVTEVQQKTKGAAMWKVGVLFDTLRQGGNSLPINAVITSITQTRTAATVSDDLTATDSGMASTSTSSPTRSTSGNSGGLLGGVTNTVGGVVNTTTQTVGGVTNTAGQTLGSTTSAVGSTLTGIQISQSTTASAGGGSTLSLGGGNLRLEKGTTFNLNVSESSSAKVN